MLTNVLEIILVVVELFVVTHLAHMNAFVHTIIVVMLTVNVQFKARKKLIVQAILHVQQMKNVSHRQRAQNVFVVVVMFVMLFQNFAEMLMNAQNCPNLLVAQTLIARILMVALLANVRPVLLEMLIKFVIPTKFYAQTVKNARVILPVLMANAVVQHHTLGKEITVFCLLKIALQTSHAQKINVASFLALSDHAFALKALLLKLTVNVVTLMNVGKCRNLIFVAKIRSV